jgi:GAF domain-containing protein
MFVSSLEWVVCLFFLGALLLVARLKPLIVPLDRKAFWYVAVGSVFLAVLSVFRVLHNDAVFEGVPLVSDAAFYHLISAIAFITGLTFLISGVSSLLVTRQRRQSDHRSTVAHLELVKQIEQLIHVENRLDTILLIALERMVGDYRFSSGSVLKISSRTSRVHTVGSVGIPPMPDSIWGQARFSGPIGETSFDYSPDRMGLIFGITNDVTRPTALVPMMVDQRPVGFFLLWGDQNSAVDRDNLQTIRVVADIIARRIDSDRLKLQTQHILETDQLRLETERALIACTDLQSATASLAAALRNEMPAEIVSLCWYHSDTAQMTRYTATSGGMLVEYKLTIPDDYVVSGSLWRTGNPVIITDTGRTTTIALDGPLAGGNVQSALAVPITAENTTVGAVMIGSSSDNAFGMRHLQLIQSLNSALIRPLQIAELGRTQTARDHRTERWLAFLAQTTADLSQETYCARAAELLARDLNLDCVRISAVEDDGHFLRSLAIAGDGISSGAVPPNGTLVLALLEHHREAIESGAPVQFDTRDQITSPELDQLFGTPCTHVRVIPIHDHDRVTGVISLAATSGSIKTSNSEEAFLQAVAVRLGEALAFPAEIRRRTTNLSGYTRAVAANRSERDLRNRLKSPLTGILGSLELMRAKEPSGDARHDHYLSIIDKSARRMQEFLDKPEVLSR